MKKIIKDKIIRSSFDDAVIDIFADFIVAMHKDRRVKTNRRRYQISPLSRPRSAEKIPVR